MSILLITIGIILINTVNGIDNSELKTLRFYNSGYINITVEEAWQLLNNTSNGLQIPIDVRTDSEWKYSHIDTPYPENPKHHCSCTWYNESIFQEFMSLYTDKVIIIYCRSGARSVTAAETLIDNGFTGTIYNMLGGLTEWISLGFPIIPNIPPDSPIITGKLNGKAGNEYEYIFISNDFEYDDVNYHINWDDNYTSYIGPFNSGEEVSINHIWENTGTYNISAKSIDKYGAESEWAILEVSMPKTKLINSLYLNIERLIQRFPILEFLL